MPQLGSKKSRKGCERCKQRRVKCDEQIPCSACVRRNERCSSLASSSNSSPETVANLALPSTSEDWIMDMELMYHYLTILSHIGARENVALIWRDYIPQQALKYPFLMHGLLAHAALHLAFQKPESSLQYLRLCDKHQAIALQKFRSILSSPVDLEYQDALFALAATLSISSMARSCALSETETMSMDSVTELFILTKGIANVIQLSKEHIRQGPMAEMLEGGTYAEGTEVHLPLDVMTRFDAMRNMLATSDLDLEALGHCESALTALEHVYKIVVYLAPLGDVEYGAVSRWQVMVSMGYLKLISAHSPPALVILAYYAAAITAVHTAWFTQNWAEYVLRGIIDVLDDGMQHWIQWPMQQIQERMRELGVQSPVEGSRFHTPLSGV